MSSLNGFGSPSDEEGTREAHNEAVSYLQGWLQIAIHIEMVY
jgi:hypothetical protein